MSESSFKTCTARGWVINGDALGHHQMVSFIKVVIDATPCCTAVPQVKMCHFSQQQTEWIEVVESCKKLPSADQKEKFENFHRQTILISLLRDSSQIEKNRTV